MVLSTYLVFVYPTWQFMAIGNLQCYMTDFKNASIYLMVVKIYNCKRTAVHFSSEISSRPKSSIGEMENTAKDPDILNDCITIP